MIFLHQDKIKEALVKDDLDYCYLELYKSPGFYETIPDFTMMLLNSSINPLNYNLTVIYPYQFYKQTGFGSNLILPDDIDWIG